MIIRNGITFNPHYLKKNIIKKRKVVMFFKFCYAMTFSKRLKNLRYFYINRS